MTNIGMFYPVGEEDGSDDAKAAKEITGSSPAHTVATARAGR